MVRWGLSKRLFFPVWEHLSKGHRAHTEENLSPGVLLWETSIWCPWDYSQMVVFTTHWCTYLHELVSLLYEPIYIIFSDVSNIASPLWTTVMQQGPPDPCSWPGRNSVVGKGLPTPFLSANMPNFDQNSVQWPLNLSFLLSAQVVRCTCPLNEVKMTRDSYSEVTRLWQLLLVKGS